MSRRTSSPPPHPPMNEQQDQARQTAAEQGTEKRAEQLLEQEDEEERRWREQMMVDIVARTGISPQQLDGVMEFVMAAIKIRVTRVAMQVAQGAVRTERARREGGKEDEKSRKSILITRLTRGCSMMSTPKASTLPRGSRRP
jgi:hypothetical protein